jgi:hypothetical protein
MAMDPRTVAIHEAGHAVMQWFVGWEADLQFIQLRRVDGGVQDSFMKILTPDGTSFSDERVARRKLLVLLAGAATTDNPADQHNRSDFNEVCMVLSILFQYRIVWKPEMGVAVVQEEPNILLQDANAMCNAIVRDPLIRNGIDVVARQLLVAECDADGVCRVCGDDIVETCRRECAAIRTQNEWSTWLTMQ